MFISDCLKSIKLKYLYSLSWINIKNIDKTIKSQSRTFLWGSHFPSQVTRFSWQSRHTWLSAGRAVFLQHFGFVNIADWHEYYVSWSVLWSDFRGSSLMKWVACQFRPLGCDAFGGSWFIVWDWRFISSVQCCHCSVTRFLFLKRAFNSLSLNWVTSPQLALALVFAPAPWYDRYNADFTHWAAWFQFSNCSPMQCTARLDCLGRLFFISRLDDLQSECRRSALMEWHLAYGCVLITCGFVLIICELVLTTCGFDLIVCEFGLIVGGLDLTNYEAELIKCLL